MEIATADSLASWRDGVARFRPDEQSGELVLRWVEPGQVTRLCRAYDRHRETEPRVLPARLVPYTSRPEGVTWPRPRQAFSDELVVFACVRGGSVARLPITSTAGISRQFRRALMHHAGTPTPEIISGHRADGTPSQTPHLAVLPLPIVSGPHPSGAIAGIALALPHDCSPDARRAVMTTIGAYERAQRSTSTSDTPEIPLHLGESGTLMLQRVAWNDGSWTLTPWSWCRPSRRWATATPIALDRNPGDLVSENPQTREAAFAAARETVIAALEQMQLPAPNAVDIVRSCVLPGTVKPRDYPRFPSQPDRAQRVLVHARIEFEQLVAGPVIIGAGRYQGLGLCLPVDDTNEAR
jgi:CRISPR-associated protein Csb2